MRATRLEAQAGAGREILDGARDQYLSGARLRHHARADVHRDTGRFVTAGFDLTSCGRGMSGQIFRTSVDAMAQHPIGIRSRTNDLGVALWLP